MDEKKCVKCASPLTGKQILFCSLKCREQWHGAKTMRARRAQPGYVDNRKPCAVCGGKYHHRAGCVR